jgi:hypothetical protein
MDGVIDAIADLGGLDDEGLRALIRTLNDEELKVSFRRRILHGQIDILRGELDRRLQKRADALG